ncbi:transposase [Bacteroides fragilis]|nr:MULTISPECIES: transposase [Bacteroides]MCS2544073.1 transposase [Bacteroides fragilis]MCS2579659.1 transposase [Bacteroides fragilis]MCS2753202.1 transposase [Bacteroides fragilis]MCS2921208.1 transposase [Bacteroides fragilis]MCS3028571.1 transposase [Bacteroides fragilis]
MFYLVKTGCQWHMLPLDLPKWQLVYYYYRKWATLLDFDLLLEKLPKDLFSLRK